MSDGFFRGQIVFSKAWMVFSVASDGRGKHKFSTRWCFPRPGGAGTSASTGGSTRVKNKSYCWQWKTPTGRGKDHMAMENTCPEG